MKSFSYLIIGPGSLGIGLGFRLSQLGFPAYFLGKDGPTKVVANLKESHSNLIYYSRPTPTAPELENVAAVFLTVKAHHLQQALGQHAGQLPKGVPVISLGNGAVENVLLQFAESNRHSPIRLGIATLAVSRLQKDIFEFRGTANQVHWGPLTPLLDPPREGETELLSADKSFFNWHEDPQPLYRKKWLFNSVLNTLAGARRARSNGILLEDRLALQQVFAEVYQLGNLLWGPWEEPAEMVYQELLELIERTHTNENSMALDVRLGRPTETDFLAGLAENFGGFPLLKSLHRKLKEDGGASLDVQGSTGAKEQVFTTRETPP